MPRRPEKQVPQSAKERRAAQRRVARALKENQNPLGGEYRIITEHALEPDWQYTKDPTTTSNPARPRSDSATYDPVEQIVNIRWARPGKLGASTNYYNVTRQQWDYLRNRANSTGRYVNNVLNNHPFDYSD
jgi:hypothetical protein